MRDFGVFRGADRLQLANPGHHEHRRDEDRHEAAREDRQHEDLRPIDDFKKLSVTPPQAKKS